TSPALPVLPTPGAGHSLRSRSEEAFRNAVRTFFDVDELDAPIDAVRATTMLGECGRSGPSLLAVTANRSFLLHHPNPNAAQNFAGLSKRQKPFGFCQPQKVLLENFLPLPEKPPRNPP